jgi:DNA-binding transcriptional MerR regulator
LTENVAGQELIRIGQVCTLLRGEFPDISISKLRFLEEQDLVRPERTPGGYRMYTHDHVEQLRAILRMQRDEFLPLKVIRDELQRRLENRRDGQGRSGGKVSFASPPSYVSEEELCRTLECGRDFLNDCERNDLVTPIRKEGQSYYSNFDREIVSLSLKLAGLGVDVGDLATLRTASEALVASILKVADGSLKATSVDMRATAVRTVETLTESLVALVRATLVRDARQAVVRGIAAGVESSQRGRSAATR